MRKRWQHRCADLARTFAVACMLMAGTFGDAGRRDVSAIAGFQQARLPAIAAEAPLADVMRDAEADPPAVAAWSVDSYPAIRSWTAAGMTFEGTWDDGQLPAVLAVLDAYADAFGRVRFLQIVSAGAVARSRGTWQQIRFVREPGRAIPAGFCRPATAEIVLSDGVWDPRHLRAYHNWSFLSGPYIRPSEAASTRQLLIAHEVAHAVINGLRAEARDAGYPTLSLERLYTQLVPAAQWPHVETDSNEHLATEIAIWIYGMPRTLEVETFRGTVLRPAVAGGPWAEALVRRFGPPLIAR